LKCESPTCFKKVFGGEEGGFGEGLEPGEINGKLQGRFSKCLRLLEKRLRKEGRWPPKLEEGASSFNDDATNEDHSLDDINKESEIEEDGGGGNAEDDIITTTQDTTKLYKN